MKNDLLKEKISMWKQKKTKLEEELSSVMIQRGEAAREGDLSENAAYKDFTEKAEVLSARIADIQKMVQKLEKGDNGGS